MDTDTSKPCELDTVIIINFGQDCDLIDEDCDFSTLLYDYLKTATPFSLRQLLANLNEIENQDDGYEVILARYNGEFTPCRWDMTPSEWVSTVRALTVEYLISNGHSANFSEF